VRATIVSSGGGVSSPDSHHACPAAARARLGRSRNRSHSNAMIALSFLCVLAPALGASPAEPLASPAAAAPLFDRYGDFQKNFKSAQQVGAYEEMTKLVRANQDEAIRHVMELANVMAVKNSDELEAEFQALARVWKDVFKTEFVNKSYRYHSELAFDRARRDERFKLERRYYELVRQYQENLGGPKEGAKFEMLAVEYAGMSNRFSELGDMYYAAQAAAMSAVNVDESNRGKEADLRRACEMWGKAVEYFERIELNHTYYQTCKVRYDGLKALGHGPAPAPDPNAPPAVDPAAAAPAAAVVATTSFEALKSLEDIYRPVYTADDTYVLWPIVNLGAKGSSGNFNSLGDKGPSVVRSEPSKIAVDVNRDGTPEKVVGLTGNFTTVDLDIGSGDDQRKWAFVFKTGIQDDRFQGLQTNLQPDDLQLRFYVMNAASVLATINAIPVRVLDDNMDGVYGSAPLTYFYAGLSDNIAQPDYDTVVVGASKRARPWSKYLEVGGAWYEVQAQKSGNAIEAKPVALETAPVKIDFKGPVQPTFLILKGTGPLDGCYFDIVSEAKKPVALPIGTYELFCGELRVGKKAQTAKCLILPGGDTRRWNVTKGAETLVTLGAPFSFDFTAEAGEESVTVKGKTVAVFGSGKERYERFWNCVPRPEVSWRKSGAKKGGKPEKMDIVMDLLERKEDGAYRFSEADTWRPIDTAFEIKKGEAVEVQLVEKKHKLFGEVESPWK
jgi:hypothetical protein